MPRRFRDLRTRAVVTAGLVTAVSILGLWFLYRYEPTAGVIGAQPGKLGTHAFNLLQNLVSVLLGIGLISLAYEVLLREAYGRDLRRFLRLEAALVSSGLQNVQAEPAFEWKETILSAGRITALIHDPSGWLLKVLPVMLEAAQKRGVAIIVGLPDMDSTNAEHVAAQVGLSRAQLTQNVSLAVETIANQWSANRNRLSDGSSIRVVSYTQPLSYELVLVDDEIVCLFPLPVDHAVGDSRLTLLFSQERDHYPSVWIRSRLAFLETANELYAALFRAIRYKGPSVYTISLSAAEDPEPAAEVLEEAIRVWDRSDWDRTVDFGTQRRDELVPLYALASPSEFFEWRDSVVATAPAGEQASLNTRFSKAFKNVLGTVSHYEFPAVVLENDLPAEAIARIFERINRTGMRLNTFDLVVARTYAPGWNLREHWEEAKRETALIERYFDDDGLPVIQTIALRDKLDIRQPALLSLDRQRVHDEWDSAVDRTERALEFVADLGTRNPAWLPYWQLVLPIAALAADFDLSRSRQILDRWFWGRALSLEYDTASSTKVSSDYRTLKEILADGEDDGISPAHVSRSTVARATRKKQSATWRAFLSLLVRREAHDLATGDPLAFAPGAVGEDFAVSSIFTNIRDAGDVSPHLLVLGLILVSKTTARSAARTSLSNALEEGAQAGADVDSLLETQFLPPLAELTTVDGTWTSLLHERLRRLEAYADSQWGDAVVFEGDVDIATS